MYHYDNNDLFRFPKEQSLKKSWMIECQVKLCLPSYRVCSNHFLPEQVQTNGLLKKHAVPSVRLSSYAVTRYVFNIQ